MSLKLQIDASGIAAQMEQFKAEIERDINEAVAALAKTTDIKVKEMARTELFSSRDTYLNSLDFQEVSQGVWVISVGESGLWVEEGIKADKDMKPDLLKRNFKTSKSGTRYKSIPFDYSKPSSQNTPRVQTVIDHMRSELKKRNIPFKNIEKASYVGNRPTVLHKLDIANPRGVKSPGKSGTPYLSGLRISQTKESSGNIRRDFMTFRTVSSGSASAGKWIHPGLDARKFLDRALAFAEKMFENDILPEILKKYK